MGLPTAVWAKVVEREMDSMTAPVEGSWGEPAWTARVPKLATGEGARGGVSTGAGSAEAAGDMIDVSVLSIQKVDDDGLGGLVRGCSCLSD